LAARAAAAPPDAATVRERMDALVDLAVKKYAPLPATSLVQLVSRLRDGAPQWQAERAAALARVRQRLAHGRVDGVDWYWPAGENPRASRWHSDPGVRLLTPFDPLVWDRRRFELFWGWAYRFEAYMPAPKRKLGYYAMPLLWNDRVIGWGNLALADGRLAANIGHVEGRAPREPAFRVALRDELDRLREFLALGR
jgi:uncharacterized protein YcaQ